MKERFYPLDIFRGATVALMILVNNPGSWNYVYPPLDHARWHGCTATDLVFPFFLFAVGNSLAFVIPRLQEQGSAAFWKKTIRRTVLIFVTGLLLNWFPFVKYNAAGELVAKTWDTLRIPGVLQRIAVCYFFASVIIFYLKPTKTFATAILLLLIYWVLCILLGKPGDLYSLQGWFGTAIDRSLLGENHLYHGEGVAFDPEGIASTLPAIVSVLLGFMAGDYIRQKIKSAANALQDANGYYPVIATLYTIAMLLVFTGLCWNTVFPLNKKIWTSSYVVYTSGLAMAVLAIIIHIVEVYHIRGGWTRFFNVFGKNPLFIFVLSGVWVRLYGLFRIEEGIKDGLPVYKGLGNWMYDHLFAPLFGNMNGSLFYAIFHVLIFWALAWWLDKKKIYIKV
ncbi:MAG: acyltransferase family protein [Agriterribacter sp.]